APSLVKNGLAVVSRSKVDPNIFSVMSLTFVDPSEYITSPSPRYWLLWPGVLMMLLYSFADIFCSLLPFFTGIHKIKFAQAFKDVFAKREIHPDDEDHTPLEDRLPTLWWTVGLALNTVMSCAPIGHSFPPQR
ncbi:hypothetical protein MPER_00963, partial [Moniliophthora perniciosa FA553]